MCLYTSVLFSCLLVLLTDELRKGGHTLTIKTLLALENVDSTTSKPLIERALPKQKIKENKTCVYSSLFKRD